MSRENYFLFKQTKYEKWSFIRETTVNLMENHSIIASKETELTTMLAITYLLLVMNLKVRLWELYWLISISMAYS